MFGPAVPVVRADVGRAGRTQPPGGGGAPQAVILAAGRGCRLNGSATPRPKCLYKVGGASLLHHQLRALSDAGVTDVVIVVGFQQDRIRQATRDAARFVVNEWFAETNSLWSFLLARPLVNRDVLVINSDVYFDPRLLGRLLEATGDAILYDSTSGHEDEHMKVSVAQGRLVAMAKDIPAARTHGENVGMLRLSAGTAEAIYKAGMEIVGRQGHLSWLAAAVSHVAGARAIQCVDIAGLPWVEIDFPHDLRRARTEVFPAVTGACAGVVGR